MKSPPAAPRPAAPVAALVKGGLALAGLVLILVVIVMAVAGSSDQEDAPARLACSDFRQLMAEMPLPPATLEQRLSGIWDHARVATTPGVDYGAHALLVTGNPVQLADACAKVPPL
jgi:hypothetical protein